MPDLTRNDSINLWKIWIITSRWKNKFLLQHFLKILERDWDFPEILTFIKIFNFIPLSLPWDIWPFYNSYFAAPSSFCSPSLTKIHKKNLDYWGILKKIACKTYRDKSDSKWPFFFFFFLLWKRTLMSFRATYCLPSLHVKFGAVTEILRCNFLGDKNWPKMTYFS